MKKLLITSAAMLFAATPAFAQEEAPAPEQPFNGLSVTALVGLDVLTIQENDEADAARGALFGGSIGYDHHVGNVVVGVQAEITTSGAKFEVEDLYGPGDLFTSEAGRDIYAGVRVGAPLGRTLLYIGGGYVNSQLTSTYDDGVDHVEQTEDKGGFRVSMGAEFQRKALFGRVEMHYQDLGDYNIFGLPSGYARTHTQIVAGLGVRF